MHSEDKVVVFGVGSLLVIFLTLFSFIFASDWHLQSVYRDQSIVCIEAGKQWIDNNCIVAP